MREKEETNCKRTGRERQRKRGETMQRMCNSSSDFLSVATTRTPQIRDKVLYFITLVRWVERHTHMCESDIG